ncbi:MAG: hypothetical protein GXN91_04220, partial [Epsilonproteobacteria bacterium]|nr:hypothetical protein [Campylobacterota bacterium]
MENILYIYPTNRAIREKKEELLSSNSFVPKMMTIAEFESRAVVVENRLVSSSERVIFLKEASKFKEFDRFKISRSLVKFYSHSSDFFRFFEELAFEKVDISTLLLADFYAEFVKDIEVLEKLFNRYKMILDKEGVSDRIFIPKSYEINYDFIRSFDGFILILEGFLTKFEVELFRAIAKIKPFTIKMALTPFNKKMYFLAPALQESKQLQEIEIDLATQRINRSSNINSSLNTILSVASSRIEQLTIAMAQIERWVRDGIEPSKIALILPDESFASVVRRFDRRGNFNFAMGKEYAKEESFILLDELLKYLKGDMLSKRYLERKNLMSELFFEKGITIDRFFEILASVGFPLYSSSNRLEALEEFNLLEPWFAFRKLLKGFRFDFREWLFLWINEIKDIKIDDKEG